jgi:hypothetical protein
MAIFDLFRRKPISPMRTIGSGGTAVYGGFVSDGEKSQDLAGRSKYISFSTMLANTTIVAAGTRFFLNLIAKPSWRAEPADDSPMARELAEFVEDTFEDMTTPWHRVIRRASMYKFYGYSLAEWTAKRRADGRIGFADIEPRPQSTIEQWDIDENGEVIGMIQRPPQTFEQIYLPRSKMIYIVDDSLSDSPEGLGLFRHLVTASLRRQRYEQLEGVGFETDLRGIPIGRVPFADIQQAITDGDLDSGKKAALEKPINDFIENHIKGPKLGIVLDSVTYQSQDESGSPSNVRKWDVELLKGGNTSQAEMNVSLTRLDHEMARVLGVEHLLLGQARGTQALSKDKSDNFALIVESALKEVRESFEADYLGPLWKLNGFDPELMPELKTDSIQYRDIVQVVDALEGLARAGAPLLPNDEAVNVVRNQAGLPPAETDSYATDAALGGSRAAPTREPASVDESSVDDIMSDGVEQ